MTTYLETGSRDPAYNLAFEEYVLRNGSEDNYLMLWQNDNAVILGRNQNAEEEINKKYVSDNGIKVVRRNTGGGAVYHDLGNLNYSFIADAGRKGELNIRMFTDLVVSALKGLGLDAKPSGRNDIVIGDSKVSGTAQHLYKDRILYHGTLLFDSDVDKIAGALNVDETKFESKSAKSVRARVGNIKDFLYKDMTLRQFWDYLKENMAGRGIVEGSISREDEEEIQRLKQEKYDTWDWNYGRAPEFTMKTKRRWSGGTIEVAITADRGVVKDVKIYGDFLALRPLEEMQDRMRDIPFKREAFLETLEDINIDEMLGSITKDELLETIFREKQ